MTIYRIDNNGRSLVYRVNTGSRGADGVSSYLHLAFADDNIGTGFNFIDGAYIGTLVDTEITSSADPTDYTWHLFRGEPGPQGIQGPVGPSVNLSIGEVTDGDSASATITGTSPNLVLNLTLPKGEKGDPGVEGPQGPKGDQGEQGVQGEQGPKGEQGDVGPAPNFSIGEIEEGDIANVTIDGSSPNYTLNFTLPKGDKGDKGETGDVGPSVNLTIGTVQKGDNANATISGTSPNYSLNLTLPKGDKGDTGEQGPQGIQGPEGPQGEKGDQGIQGIQGQKGDKGDIGPAPNLSIGSVTSGQTANASISGSNPNYQLNLVLPQGPKGDAGDQGPIGQTGPKGDQGPEGPQGEKGEKGDTGNTGPAPNLTIGTVQGGASAQATISGSNPNYQLNLTLPKGDTGAQGPAGYTPVKGTDYWTTSDIESIENDLKAYVDTEIGQINTTLDEINGEVV